jgi:hypothetical protein
LIGIDIWFVEAEPETVNQFAVAGGVTEEESLKFISTHQDMLIFWLAYHHPCH